MSSSNSPLSSVRRILKELSDLNSEESSDYKIHLVDDQLFELHFTIRGPPDTPYVNGLYHGKLILPHDYPFRPPEIVFLTPSGRFEINKKICLSVTNFHPETWQPAWGLRTFMIGITSFMTVESADSIGSMQWTSEERQAAAVSSKSWICPDCKSPNSQLLPDVTSSSTSCDKPPPPVENDELNIQASISSTSTSISLSRTPELGLSTSPLQHIPSPGFQIQRSYLDILIVCLLIIVISLILT
ncbi:Ubiquitin-conjugating enzyme E2 J1 [Coelomomyces lativittatus]|nr:Ubiquitin-conjugating enzyme E2 J1 [Coelomomyces lativittatus]KAJ1507447.1 Ubiquitin-conjugating enzyme E2 J1 [Coelomomyces lativittatus]KAJ1514278.1 Ubiquitin-conjugating enzyme E2 J1 [Coelomomyces lativittatus]